MTWKALTIIGAAALGLAAHAAEASAMADCEAGIQEIEDATTRTRMDERTADQVSIHMEAARAAHEAGDAEACAEALEELKGLLRLDSL